MEQMKTLRFGILGPGGIAHKFADAVMHTDRAQLAAVASTRLDRAQSFAEEFGIPAAYGSYEELLADPSIDAVYIAAINVFHYGAAKLALEAGKAVLCEKPFCMSAAQTEELIALAESKNLLLMEGLWTLFLPCITAARSWIREGRIGTLKYMDSAFSFFTPVIPDNRYYDAENGGGAAFDVGIYCLAFSISMAGELPDCCRSHIYTGETGVDEMGAALLHFSNQAVANCVFGLQGNIASDGHIFGSKGAINLPQFWNSHEAQLLDTEGKILEAVTSDVENGFVYEIEAFCDAFLAGKTEVETVSHELMKCWSHLLDEIREVK